MLRESILSIAFIGTLVLGIGDFERGNRHYRAGRYEEAQQYLEAALEDVDPALRQRTLYNLGNRFLEEGRGTGEAERRDQLLDAAIAVYKEALRLDPADQDAKWNLELALREQDEPPENPQQEPQDDQQEQRDQESGGGGNAPSPNAPQGDEQGGGGENQAPLTPEQAEQIMNAVEQDERELYQEQLRRGARETPVVRDW